MLYVWFSEFVTSVKVTADSAGLQTMKACRAQDGACIKRALCHDNSLDSSLVLELIWYVVRLISINYNQIWDLSSHLFIVSTPAFCDRSCIARTHRGRSSWDLTRTNPGTCIKTNEEDDINFPVFWRIIGVLWVTRRMRQTPVRLETVAS